MQLYISCTEDLPECEDHDQRWKDDGVAQAGSHFVQRDEDWCRPYEVLPGDNRVYEWDVTDADGPGPADASSALWVYQSHVGGQGTQLHGADINVMRGLQQSAQDLQRSMDALGGRIADIPAIPGPLLAHAARPPPTWHPTCHERMETVP